MDLVVLEMEDYYVILGMDWLSNYHAYVDYYHKMVTIQFEDRTTYTFQGEQMLNMPSFISYAKVQKLLKKGYVAWIIVVSKEEMNKVYIHEVSIMNEFLDVFLEELPRLLPDWEVEFTTNLLLAMKLISIPPYQMSPMELKE